VSSSSVAPPLATVAFYRSFCYSHVPQFCGAHHIARAGVDKPASHVRRASAGLLSV
jgi:hypothetical protein